MFQKCQGLGDIMSSQGAPRGGFILLSSDRLAVRDIAAAQDDMAGVFGIDRIHRAFDFAAAAIGLVLFAPILLITSIAIKLDFAAQFLFASLNSGATTKCFKPLIFAS